MTDRVKWGKGRREFFRQWARHELDRVFGNRSVIERQWRQWLEQYRAPKDRGIAHFPFEGASNITVPVTAMNVDPILARYMANIHASDNLWTLKPLNERWIATAKPLQDYLTWIDQNQLKMWDVNYRVFLEMLKLGTGIYKTGWRYEQRRKMGYDESRKRARILEIVNQPFVDHVHLSNFYIPPEARNIDPDAQHGAQWVAERHIMRPLQLQAMARGQEPYMPNFDPEVVQRVMAHMRTSQPEHEQTINWLEQVDPTLSLQNDRPIWVFEIHARFDTTGNGIEDDIVVMYHYDTLDILRATYEPLPGRPYSSVRYLRGDGFYGIGVCEQADVWQDVISRVLNFNIDKILLSNAPMLGVKEGANVIPDEPIFPGKQWHLSDPKNDLTPFFLTSPGSFDINMLTQYLEVQARQRTGVNDLQKGEVGALPSRTPATTIQSLLQEGNTRFDLSIKDLRQSGLSDVGLKVLQELQMQAADPLNNPDAQDYVMLAPMILGQPEGQFVQAALTIPGEAIETGIGVQLTATSGLNNKELMKQSNLALIQVTSQLAPGFIQLAQLAQQGGPVGEVALQMFNGGRELLSRLLEQFDVRNPEEVVPNLQAALQAQAQIAQGQSVSPMGGFPGPGAPQGMGGF